MAEPATGRAGGKVILCGEHAVVYGHPAIAASIERGTSVRLTPAVGRIEIHSVHGVDARLRTAVEQVVGTEGWRVDIMSDLPMGRGMGSSAALSVALVRAWSRAQGTPMDLATEHARSLSVEAVFHGTPSGIDNAVAAAGGVVRFRRTAQGPVWTAVDAPVLPVAVLDSGTAGDTKVLVAGVRARHPGNTALLDAIGALADPIEAALGDVHTLGPLFLRNHDLLDQLGVSTPELDALVQLALDAGATGAKLAGAGGGGIVIAVGPDPHAIVAQARARGVDAFVTLIQRKAR